MNRLIRIRTLVICLLSLGALIGVACGSSDDDSLEDRIHSVLKTESLEIVDKAGNPRGVFTVADNGQPSLTMTDQSGAFRAWLSLTSDGAPNLILIHNGRVIHMDGEGEIRSSIQLDTVGSPSISFTDTDGRTRTLLRQSEAGQTTFQILDENLQPVWTAP